ncbi:MAG: acetyl-CoA carboxylase biotin carboxyl carrier protein subunit, partial [Bacteroidaceae bacterium]
MKEYKYKINGNQYKVAVGDIDDNIVQVEVNGTPFKVEIDKPAKEAVTVSRPAARTAAKPAAKP